MIAAAGQSGPGRTPGSVPRPSTWSGRVSGNDAGQVKPKPPLTVSRESASSAVSADSVGSVPAVFRSPITSTRLSGSAATRAASSAQRHPDRRCRPGGPRAGGRRRPRCHRRRGERRPGTPWPSSSPTPAPRGSSIAHTDQSPQCRPGPGGHRWRPALPSRPRRTLTISWTATIPAPLVASVFAGRGRVGVGRADVLRCDRQLGRSRRHWAGISCGTKTTDQTMSDTITADSPHQARRTAAIAARRTSSTAVHGRKLVHAVTHPVPRRDRRGEQNAGGHRERQHGDQQTSKRPPRTARIHRRPRGSVLVAGCSELPILAGPAAPVNEPRGVAEPPDRRRSVTWALFWRSPGRDVREPGTGCAGDREESSIAGVRHRR